MFVEGLAVNVRWAWLIVSLTLLLLSSILLAGTIINSKPKVRIWKSSIVALLQALDKDTRQEIGALDYTSTLNKRAEKIMLPLERDEDGQGGWRLVQHKR
jgi:hypothetical protein